MLRNHLLVTLRRLRRDAGYATVNLTGLAIGLAACLLIGLYVRHALSFDTFHPAAEQTYRVVQKSTFANRQSWGAYSSGHLAPYMRDNQAGVEAATRLKGAQDLWVRHQGRATSDLRGIFAEPEFFSLFGFALHRGQAAALTRPNTAVLTQSLADRLFPEDEAVGQTVQTNVYDQPTTLEVVGVMHDPPSNTHLGDVDLLVSFASLQTEDVPIAIGNAQFSTYVRLAGGQSPDAIAERLASHIKDVHAGGARVNAMRLQPLPSIYFGDLGAPRKGDIRYVALFGAIAFIILLIACVNYTNLATARTTQRGHETGVRKTLGARRRGLVLQFLSEAVVLSLLAVPLTLVLVQAALPYFNTLTDVSVALSWTADAPILGAVLGVALGTGILAGTYPALVLSGYRPLQVLRQRSATGEQGKRIRQGLVVMQFALTAALLFATGMVLRQLDFLQTHNPGFAEERVVALPLSSESVRERAEVLRTSVASLTGVERVTLTSGLPGSRIGYFGRTGSAIEWNGEDITIQHGYVDTTFAQTLDLTLVAGRFLRAGDAPQQDGSTGGSTAEPVVLNETAAEALGWVPAHTAVGGTLSYFRGDKPIVGVVKDFHFRSLHHRVEPLAMHYIPQYANRVLAVRLSAGTASATLDRVEAAWDEVAPAMPFEPRFLDAAIDQQYRAEQRAAHLITAFSAVAILLACLGLFGLATYAAERRTKEIGIRKAIGATTRQLVARLTREFAVLVALALVLGLPVALYAVGQWLDGFAYQAPFTLGTFAWTAGVLMATALLTASVQTIRAARLDPAETLRSE